MRKSPNKSNGRPPPVIDLVEYDNQGEPVPEWEVGNAKSGIQSQTSTVLSVEGLKPINPRPLSAAKRAQIAALLKPLKPTPQTANAIKRAHVAYLNASTDKKFNRMKKERAKDRRDDSSSMSMSESSRRDQPSIIKDISEPGSRSTSRRSRRSIGKKSVASEFSSEYSTADSDTGIGSSLAACSNLGVDSDSIDADRRISQATSGISVSRHTSRSTASHAQAESIATDRYGSNSLRSHRSTSLRSESRPNASFRGGSRQSVSLRSERSVNLRDENDRSHRSRSLISTKEMELKGSRHVEDSAYNNKQKREYSGTPKLETTQYVGAGVSEACQGNSSQRTRTSVSERKDNPRHSRGNQDGSQQIVRPSLSEIKAGAGRIAGAVVRESRLIRPSLSEAASIEENTGRSGTKRDDTNPWTSKTKVPLHEEPPQPKSIDPWVSTTREPLSEEVRAFSRAVDSQSAKDVSQELPREARDNTRPSKGYLKPASANHSIAAELKEFFNSGRRGFSSADNAQQPRPASGPFENAPRGYSYNQDVRKPSVGKQNQGSELIREASEGVEVKLPSSHSRMTSAHSNSRSIRENIIVETVNSASERGYEDYQRSGKVHESYKIEVIEQKNKSKKSVMDRVKLINQGILKTLSSDPTNSTHEKYGHEVVDTEDYEQEILFGEQYEKDLEGELAFAEDNYEKQPLYEDAEEKSHADGDFERKVQNEVFDAEEFEYERRATQPAEQKYVQDDESIDPMNQERYLGVVESSAKLSPYVTSYVTSADSEGIAVKPVVSKTIEVVGAQSGGVQVFNVNKDEIVQSSSYMAALMEDKEVNGSAINGSLTADGTTRLVMNESLANVFPDLMQHLFKTASENNLKKACDSYAVAAAYHLGNYFGITSLCDQVKSYVEKTSFDDKTICSLYTDAIKYKDEAILSWIVTKCASHISDITILSPLLVTLSPEFFERVLSMVDSENRTEHVARLVAQFYQQRKAELDQQMCQRLMSVECIPDIKMDAAIDLLQIVQERESSDSYNDEFSNLKQRCLDGIKSDWAGIETLQLQSPDAFIKRFEVLHPTILAEVLLFSVQRQQAQVRNDV